MIPTAHRGLMLGALLALGSLAVWRSEGAEVAWRLVVEATLVALVLFAYFGAARRGKDADSGTRNPMQELQDAGTVVVESSARQNYGFTLFEKASGRIKASVQGMVEHLQEFRGRLARSASVVSEVKSLAAVVRADSEAGVQQSHEAAAAAKEAARIARETRHTVDTLAEHSLRIGEVVTLIGAIAKATHILSFNAAIEAARAGESGRGFAVVAAEVQRLATQTQDATGEVRDRVTAIVETCQGVVASITALDGMVVGNAERAAAASDSLSRVIGQINGISDSVASIADAAAQQSRDSEVLNDLGAQIAESLLNVVEHVSDVKDANDRIFDSSISLKEALRTLDTRDARDPYPLLPLCELVRSYTAKCIKVATPAAAAEYRRRCEALDRDVQQYVDNLHAAGDAADRAFTAEFRRHYEEYRGYCYDTMEQVARGRIDVALAQIGTRNVPKYVELKSVLMRKCGIGTQAPRAT